jgi:hypothetical protein
MVRHHIVNCPQCADVLPSSREKLGTLAFSCSEDDDEPNQTRHNCQLQEAELSRALASGCSSCLQL